MTAAPTLPRIVTILVECDDRTVVVLAPFHHFNPKGCAVYRGGITAELAAESVRLTVEGLPVRSMLELTVDA